MILKNLELNGFKSFVDETKLDFTRGFTAVVGPNGCGKSNVSDAIRWVIGEQSSKHLRGTRIADLIFNGSGSRKPVNRAEVSMTLADVPEGLRIANIPNLSEEIKVTRCYHRSGESEFYINNIPCRLKDITDLFLDIGISPKVLTVIEQGHIQDIVTSKPDERRLWIEEAAGVLKFKTRKNEALRKLDSSGQNLDRISDIVQELSRQVESLKRQAAKAERYKQFQTEIKELSLNLFARKIRRSRVELEEIETLLKSRTEQKEQWGAQAATVENQIEQMKIELDGLISALNEKKELVHTLKAGISQNEHNIEIKKTQISQSRADMESAAEEIETMRREIGQAEAESTALQEEKTRLVAEIQIKEAEREEQNQSHETQKSRLIELEEQIAAVDGRIMDLFNQLSQKKSDLTALETRQQSLRDRDAKLAGEQNEVKQQVEVTVASVQTADAGYKEKAQVFEALQAEQEQRQQREAGLESALAQQEEAAHLAREAYLSRNSLLQSLSELRKKFEGFGEGVKALMANGSRDHVGGLREVLVDVVKAPADYEQAIEAVLGDKLQSMIVDSYSDTKQAIDYLDTNQSGRGTFIPLQPKSAVHAPLYLNGNQGVVGKLSDLVEIRQEYRAILDHLLGRVVLVRDLDTAFSLHAHQEFDGTIVTLKGEVIDEQGMVTGGSRTEKESSLLSQNREMEELTGQVATLKQDQETQQAAVRKLEEDLTALEEEIKAGSQSVHAADIERAHRYNELEQLRKEQDRLQQKLSTLEYERSSAAHELRELEGEKDTLNADLVRAAEEKENSEAQRTSLRSEAAAQREDLERQGLAIHALNVEITALKGKLENIELESRRLEQQRNNLNERIQRREQDTLNNRNRIGECEEAIAGFEKEIMEQVREKEQLSETIVKEDEHLREQEEILKRQEQQAKELVRHIQEITEEISKVELKRSETRMQVSHIEEKAWEDFNVSLDEMLNSYNGEIDEEEVSEQLSGLKDKVAKMGEVNLAALSEYQVANERYMFLHKQQEDLAQSILTLHETIEKIDQTTKQLFTETFEAVNEHFKSNFERLFKGGAAEMSLADPDDPLESGIEIAASPPGKTMQNISLMSGGEKAMTAIALVFAILQVRPSPFCLLDEVDAPLDEANVTRFQDMLQEMSVNTQFIMITHNQKTMSFADTLYGVTMEERGVSKVVSVNLNN